jgi:thioredoxin-like negative regulator of GroEL
VEAISQADNLINQKNYNEAEKILLAQLNNESKAALTDTIKIKLAECYIGNGNSQKAKAIYEDMLKSSPKGEITPIAKKMLQQL